MSFFPRCERNPWVGDRLLGRLWSRVAVCSLDGGFTCDLVERAQRRAVRWAMCRLLEA